MGYVVGVDDFWVHVAVGKGRPQIWKVPFSMAFAEEWGSYLSSEVGKGWDGEVSFFTPNYWKATIM